MVFIVFRFHVMDRGIGTAVRVKSLQISRQFLYFHSKLGRMRSVEEFSEK